VIALRQDNLKRRLAFSTVSQLSYIVLGIAVGAWAAGAAGVPDRAAALAIVGGLLHIPAHAFMKLTLFFCAGALHVETHTDDISNMAGIGRRMPLTMGAFAVAAAGMAGIPAVAGFVSKYFLLVGSVAAGGTAFALALLVSGVLNVAYFWPVVYTAFFETPATADTKPLVEGPLGGWFGPGVATDGGGSPPDGGPDDAGAPPGAGDADDEGEVHTEHGFAPDHEGQDHLDEHAHDVRWTRHGWTGGEASWFVLAPILFAAAGSVVLGVVPDAAVFLRVVRLVVSLVTGVSV
ncbi:MAG: proton-conducting transporter membrane subunit, partial [Halorientalis sp.]